MMPSVSFRIHVPKVVHETIDDETTIIDFETGAYYSTTGSGALVWQAIEKGSSVEDMLDMLLQHYNGERPQVEQALRVFLGDLIQQSLIVAADNAHDAPLSENTLQPSNGRSPFVAPLLHKFTDMADLLLLDPIHDVDEQGWPIKKDVSIG